MTHVVVGGHAVLTVTHQVRVHVKEMGDRVGGGDDDERFPITPWLGTWTPST